MNDKWDEEYDARIQAEYEKARLEKEQSQKEIIPRNCYLCDAGPEVHNLHLPNSHCKTCTFAYPPLPQKSMDLDTEFQMNVIAPVKVSFKFFVQEATKNMPVAEKKATLRKLINELTDMMEKA